MDRNNQRKWGAYALHLDKSKGGRKREMDSDRRKKGEKVVDELCDTIYSFQSKTNFTAI